MNKSPNSTFHEDGDETMLFDDGFSIVDDINVAAGIMEVDKPNKVTEKSTLKKEAEKVTGKKETTKSNSDVSKSKMAEKEEVAEDKLQKEVSDSKSMEEQKEIKIEGEEGETNKNNAKPNDELKEKVSSNSKESLESVKGQDLDSTFKITTNHSTIISNDNETSEISIKIENPEQNEEPKKTESNKAKVNPKINTPVNKTTLRKKNSDTCFVWVSNISKLVKASSLKKHFSDCGKVNTAKVVTNGKVFFGYVELETAEHAANCVNKMNNTILGGKKILVSRSRPDVTKKTANSGVKKTAKHDPLTLKHVDKPEEPVTSTPKSAEENPTPDEKEKKRSPPDTKKPQPEKRKGSDEKRKDNDSKKSSLKDAPIVKNDGDLRLKLNDSKRRMDKIKNDLDKSQIEARSLHRRLMQEQKRSKNEQLRSEKYRMEARSLSDQLKQLRSDYDKEIHLLNKKHKLDLEKAEYQRDHYLKQREDLKRRQEDLDREFKKLDEAKKIFEHIKRSRKSRSPSPPSKRFRDRSGMYPEHRSPPPPPKLSSDSRGKMPERSTYYEEKKQRGVYDRLGDYVDKGFSKEMNGGRHRGGGGGGAYPGDSGSVLKAPMPWGAPPAETWKKPNTSSTYLKTYVERFPAPHTGYPLPGGSYYPASSAEYSKHGHFDSTRKY